MKPKKTTLATLKSFIRKNREALYISVKSQFDGMYDSVMPVENKGFHPAQTAGAGMIDRTLGISGAWVCTSGNYITPYDNGSFQGYSVWNCCGEFVLAIPV